MSGLRSTNTVLDQIVLQKTREVETLRISRRGRPSPPSVNGAAFLARLRDPTLPGRAVIAEIKRASPSAGLLRPHLSPEEIARAYAENGARCLSVITDENFFQGSLSDLGRARAADLPLLRKDFIIDPLQIAESAETGAQAVLLIARILDQPLFRELYAAAADFGLAALIEVHNQEDLERALQLSPPPSLIGINNRDLADFSVSVNRTLRLLPLLPPEVTAISESGIADAATMDRLRAAGAHAFLIGTSLMKAPDPGAALRKLVYG